MGDDLTGNQGSTQTSSRSYGDIFDELFPHYLLMGMTPEQYWDGESWLKPAYRKAYKMRMENEQRITDMHNWYMGKYLIKALQAVPLLVAGLNVKSSTKLPEYPSKPFMIEAEERKQEEVRKQKQEDQQKLAIALFQQFTTKFNKNITKRLEKEKAEKTGQ